MLHPPQFLQKILATPLDDGPRLHYADWLEESRNPLGEFIRLQCRLAQMTRAPEPLNEHWREQERRAHRLLAEFHGPWSLQIAGCVEWYSFRRGFIEEISLTEKQLLAHGADLFRLVPVMDMHLTTSGAQLDVLPEIPYLRHTVFFDLSSQPLEDEGVERLADTPFLAQIHGLNLGSCCLGDGGFDALMESPDLGALRELYLNDNPITDDSLRRFVLSPHLEQLQVLDVRGTAISQEGVDVLRYVLGDRLIFSPVLSSD